MSNTMGNVTYNPNYQSLLTISDQLFCMPDGHLITHQSDKVFTYVCNDSSHHIFYLGKYKVSHAWGNHLTVPNQDTFLDYPDVKTWRMFSWWA